MAEEPTMKRKPFFQIISLDDRDFINQYKDFKENGDRRIMLHYINDMLDIKENHKIEIRRWK